MSRLKTLDLLHHLEDNYAGVNHGRRPTVVLMHPKMYMLYVRDLRAYNSVVVWTGQDEPFNFNGAKVKRTYDLDENEIEMY